jgi:hypothetical protein
LCGLLLWIFCRCANSILSNLEAISQGFKTFFTHFLCNWWDYSKQFPKIAIPQAPFSFPKDRESPSKLIRLEEIHGTVMM